MFMVRRMVRINSNIIASAGTAQITQGNNFYQQQVQKERRRSVLQILVIQEKLSPLMANVKNAQLILCQLIRELASVSDVKMQVSLSPPKLNAKNALHIQKRQGIAEIAKCLIVGMER